MKIREQILKVADRMGQPGQTPTQTAIARGWIDANGVPTEKGYHLTDALSGRPRRRVARPKAA